jgi:hypothetical protein
MQENVRIAVIFNSAGVFVRNCRMHFLSHEKQIKENKFVSRPQQREGDFEDCSGLSFLRRKPLEVFFFKRGKPLTSVKHKSAELL